MGFAREECICIYHLTRSHLQVGHCYKPSSYGVLWESLLENYLNYPPVNYPPVDGFNLYEHMSANRWGKVPPIGIS